MAITCEAYPPQVRLLFAANLEPTGVLKFQIPEPRKGYKETCSQHSQQLLKELIWLI